MLFYKIQEKFQLSGIYNNKHHENYLQNLNLNLNFKISEVFLKTNGTKLIT